MVFLPFSPIFFQGAVVVDPMPNQIGQFSPENLWDSEIYSKNRPNPNSSNLRDTFVCPSFNAIMIGGVTTDADSNFINPLDVTEKSASAIP